jgi:hypothetical protein
MSCGSTVTRVGLLLLLLLMMMMMMMMRQVVCSLQGAAAVARKKKCSLAPAASATPSGRVATRSALEGRARSPH